MTRWSEATLADPTPTQCPECGAAGSLVDFFCEVCYAELDEVASEITPPTRQDGGVSAQSLNL